MRSLRIVWAVDLALVICGCRVVQVSVAPGFKIKPTDRLAMLDTSTLRTSTVGRRVTEYLINKFVEMDLQVVERSEIETVLKELNLDPTKASDTELAAAVTSLTKANLVGIHKITAYENTPIDKERAEEVRRFRISGFLRIIDVADNRVVVAATANFRAKSRHEEATLQRYATTLYKAVKSRLAKTQARAGGKRAKG